MQWLRRIVSRQRRYDDLSVSVREHLDETIDELIAGGMTRPQAEQAARRQFGNVTLFEERSREAWQVHTLETMAADAKHALRQCWKAPAMAIIIVLTLALGVGAATSVFSVAYGVLVNPFPYKDVQTLVTPKLCTPELARCYWDTYTPAQFLELARNTTFFQAVTASTVGNVTITGDGEAQQIRGNYLTANTFDVLGVQPLLGRASAPDDVSPGHEPVALLSYRYWQSHFGGSASVLGHVITVDGTPRSIIGVMPPRFLWRGADVYLPVLITPAEEIAGQSHFTLVGRVKPGTSEAQAAGELQPIFQDFIHADPTRYPKAIRVGLMGFAEMFQSGLKGTLYLLLAAVSVMLLIACVNVASLLLANAVKREHEFVLRAAVGASRVRLVRQVLIESLLLALLSIPVALLFAYGGLQAMLHLVPANTIPDEALITLNLPVLLMSIAASLLTVLLSGLSPAWYSANPRLSEVLTSTRTTGGQGHRRVLNGFVIAEMALSLALLALAGLMMRSMFAVERLPILFPPDHTVMMRVPLAPKRYPRLEDKTRFFNRLLEQTSHIPGVDRVTVDSELPFLWGFGSRIRIGGQPVNQNDFSNVHMVTPDYLGMSGLAMVEGHFIDDREVSVKAPEAVVSEDFVKRFFPAGNALGQSLRLIDSGLPPANGSAELAVTIIGIIRSLPSYPGYQTKRPDIFLPYTLVPVMDTVIVTTRLPADDLVQPIRRVVSSIDRDQPVTDAMSLRSLLNRYGYAGPRFALTLFGTFAAAALLLSWIGIYGVFSFATSRRTQEIGVRMALGADRTAVMAMVLRQASRLALTGIALGLPLALLAARFAKDELFSTPVYDPVTFVAVICVLPLLALAGTWLPARRAAAVDPMTALRTE